MRKIVIASDSFKGSLTSLEVAQAAEAGIRKVYPACEVVKVPIADGGEGTVDALIEFMGGVKVACKVHNPLMEQIDAYYGVLGDGKTAVIEMAAASGLTLLEAGRRNPLYTTTYGTGELIMDAIARGCNHLIIGVGGSATNDGGIGMLTALGFVFRDSKGMQLEPIGAALSEIAYIDTIKAIPLHHIRFSVASDVTNPFFGPNGAAHVFARQKGADDDTIQFLDAGMTHFAHLIRRLRGIDLNAVPGTGAAGGLGGAFMAFLNSSISPGIDLILETICFRELIKKADLIITGEGRMDSQTCMGKAPIGVLRFAEEQQIPVIALAGSVQDEEVLTEAGFMCVMPVLPAPVSLQKAMDKEYAQKNISRTVWQLLRLIHYYE